MEDHGYTPEGLPIIINPKNLVGAILADVEKATEREFNEVFDNIFERIERENKGYISVIKDVIKRQYGQELEGEEVEVATMGFILGYEILRRQAEANKLERDLKIK